VINLLAPDDRRQLAAARTNTLLVRYVILLTLFIVLLFVEMGGVYVFLSAEKAQDEQSIAENDAKNVSYAPVKAQADSFRSNLATAKYILDQQVPYTKLIITIASVLPQDVIIDRLTLDPSNFGTPTTLSVKAKSYADLIQVKSNMQKSKLFSDVNFQSISSASGDDESGSYSHTAVMNITYTKEGLNL